MEPIATVLPAVPAASAPSSASAPTTQPQRSANPAAEQLSSKALRTLWERMAEVYGHRWTSAYGEDAEAGAGITWAKGLAGITPQQLAAGLSSSIASADPWPPTLPEFRARCLGIPPLATVRLDVKRAAPFTRLVWQHLDGFRYRQAPADQADRLLREAYELAREHVMRGGQLPRVSGVLPSEKPQPKPVDPAGPEEIKARLERARAEAGLPPEGAEEAEAVASE